MTDNIELLPYSCQCKARLHKLTGMLRKKIPDAVSIVLFGSYARLEQTAFSDLDILVLTENEADREIRGELCSEFDELHSDLIFYTVKQFEASDSLLARQIRKDGILLWKN